MYICCTVTPVIMNEDITASGFKELKPVLYLIYHSNNDFFSLLHHFSHTKFTILRFCDVILSQYEPIKCLAGQLRDRRPI